MWANVLAHTVNHLNVGNMDLTAPIPKQIDFLFFANHLIPGFIKRVPIREG